MDIEFTEEQEMLRQSVQRLLKDDYTFDERRTIIASDEGFSRALWKKFAELGLLGAPLAEEYGGFGNPQSRPLTTMIVMQELGRGLVVEPYFETVVVAGGLLEAAGTDTQRKQHLPAIAEGKAIWALAWTEPGGRYHLDDVQTMATKRGDEYVLEGRKSAVIAAPWADYLIVSARTSGNRRDADGVSLFIIDRKAPGITLTPFKTLDGRRAAEITLKDVKVPASALLGGVGKGAELLEACRDRAIGALAAEAVGALTELNAATLDYAKTRKQFGVALGTFQALQHRMVDMFVAREEALSLMQHLTLSLAAKEAGVSKLASGVKSKIGDNARRIGQEAIQLHGGMGMTEELIVGHYFKRLTSIELQFGDSGFHLMRFARSA